MRERREEDGESEQTYYAHESIIYSKILYFKVSPTVCYSSI